jgi:hypothetical protein
MRTGVALVADFKHTQPPSPATEWLSTDLNFVFAHVYGERAILAPMAKRQRTDAAAQPHGDCDSLEGAARACCTTCLNKLLKAEPPLSRKEIEKAVKHVAGRTKWWRSTNRAPDCCDSLKLLLSAASVATAAAEHSEHVSNLSHETVRACETGCVVCTLELLKYQDAHLGHAMYIESPCNP